jgi:hypothetical protein
MEAEFFPGQAEGLDHVVDGLVFDGGGYQALADPFDHPGIFFRGGVQVFGDILDIFALDAADCPAEGV